MVFTHGRIRNKNHLENEQIQAFNLKKMLNIHPIGFQARHLARPSSNPGSIKNIFWLVVSTNPIETNMRKSYWIMKTRGSGGQNPPTRVGVTGKYLMQNPNGVDRS